MAATMLVPNGHVVVRIGTKATNAQQLPEILLGAALASPRKVLPIRAEFTEIRRRQTNAFRPGSKGLRTEVDCLFRVE